MGHGRIYDDVTRTMGGTPLIRLNRLGAGLPARIAVKHEGYNPFSSVKDRIGVAMLEDAIASGRLKPGMTIVEPTSGNTGIGIAYAAAVLGYPCIFVMPDTMTVERRHMLRALGARVELTEGPKGMKAAIARAEEIAAGLGDRAWIPQQFTNAANPAVHYRTTGPEIWEDTNGAVDIFISGIGTGGTITGAGRYLRVERPVDQLARDAPHATDLGLGVELARDLVAVPGTLDQARQDRPLVQGQRAPSARAHDLPSA
jgi:cysteine synthase A